MAVSAFSGPITVFGQGPSPDNNPNLGPSSFFAGGAVADPRPQFSYTPGQDSTEPFYVWSGDSGILLTLYVVPQTKSTTIIATAQHTTTATAMVLASTVATGVATGVTVTRQDTGVAVTGLVELDPLNVSITANVTVGSNVLTVTTVSTGTAFHPAGIVPGMVLTDSTHSTAIPANVTISAFGTGNGGLGTYIMSANALLTETGDTITGLYTATPSAIPSGLSGQIRTWNPYTLCSRAVIVTSNSATQTGGSFTVSSLDIYGFPITETIAIASATSATGLKAHKYIKSVVPNFTDATLTYSIGTTDIIGLPLRSDTFQVGMPEPFDVAMMANNAAVTTTTGYVAAVKTTSNATSGDVRGTYALQTTSNGTLAFGVSQAPLDPGLTSAVGMFGVTQFAAW